MSLATIARSRIMMKLLKFLALCVLAVITFALILLYEVDIPADVIDAKYSSPSSMFVTLGNEARVHYRDEGNRQGKPIVLIHGFGASLHTWSSWVELLGDEFRLISLDLPAHGLTGAAPNGDYSTNAFVETVKLLVDHLELTSFTVGGHSMGGNVAWRYALTHPNNVESIILVNAAGIHKWHNPNKQSFAFSLLKKEWFRSIGSTLDPYYLVSQVVHSAYNNSPIVNDEMILRYYQMIMREGSREAIMTRSNTPSKYVFTEADLKTLTHPTLILWGQDDAIIDASIATKFDEMLENSTLVIYEETGHVPMEEIPEISANDVKNFMQNLSANL